MMSSNYFIEAVLLSVYLILSNALSEENCQVHDIFCRLDDEPALKSVPGPRSDSKAFAVPFGDSVEFPVDRLFASFSRDYCIATGVQLDEPVKGSAFVFSITDPKRQNVWTALSLLSSSRLNFEYSLESSSTRTKKATFSIDMNKLNDGNWHSIVACVRGSQAFASIDCQERETIKIQEPRRDLVSGTAFVGRKTSRGSAKRHAVLKGNLADLFVFNYSQAIADDYCREPTMMTPTQTPTGSRVVGEPNDAVNVSKRKSECTDALRGRLWFDAVGSALKLCDGTAWQCLRCPDECKVDYFDLVETLPTVAASDADVFRIDDTLYMCVTEHSDPESPDAVSQRTGPSTIYRHDGTSWIRHQRIDTDVARACHHFAFADNDYLAVANFGKDRSSSSTIYRYDAKTRQFVFATALERQRAQDIEFFCVNATRCYLALARRSDADNVNTDSPIYAVTARRDGGGGIDTQRVQLVPTSSAYDWEHFVIDGRHYLVVANAFNGRTTHVDSIVYEYDSSTGRFEYRQAIPTIGATGWTHFRVDDDDYLAVANAFDHRPSSSSSSSPSNDRHAVVSVIYKYDGDKFVSYQRIMTYSGTGWSAFTICGRRYLAVTNSYSDNDGNSVESIVYAYRGAERFVAEHAIETEGATDWVHYSIGGRDYLVLTNSKGGRTKILVAKTR